MLNWVKVILDNNPLASIDLITSDNASEVETAVDFISQKYWDIENWMNKIIEESYKWEEFTEERKRRMENLSIIKNNINSRYKNVEEALIREKADINFYGSESYDKEIFDEFQKQKNNYLQRDWKFSSPESIKAKLNEAYNTAKSKVEYQRIIQRQWWENPTIPNIQKNWINMNNPQGMWVWWAWFKMTKEEYNPAKDSSFDSFMKAKYGEAELQKYKEERNQRKIK